MKLPRFRLEDYLAQYEFKAPYLFCCSDAESWTQKEILDLADAEMQEAWGNLNLGYTEVPGHPLLREAIARLYPGLTAENILCFGGAEEGIFCSANVLCRAGDHAIVFTPCYQSLQDLPLSLGAEVTGIELKEKDRWLPDLDALKSAIRPNTRALLINFPHNPTGAMLPAAIEQEILNLADQHGFNIFSDEVYRLLGGGGTSWRPPLATQSPNAISLGVVSKAYGLPGLRIGWIACQDTRLLKEIEYVKYYTSICCSAPSELLSTIALRSGEKLLERNNALVNSNLKLLDHFFEKHTQHFSWVRPQGGCVGFVHYKGKTPVDTLAQELIQQQGVLIVPGSIFSAPGNDFRIGFGRKNMPEVLARFEAFEGFKLGAEVAKA